MAGGNRWAEQVGVSQRGKRPMSGQEPPGVMVIELHKLGVSG